MKDEKTEYAGLGDFRAALNSWATILVLFSHGTGLCRVRFSRDSGLNPATAAGGCLLLFVFLWQAGDGLHCKAGKMPRPCSLPVINRCAMHNLYPNLSGASRECPLPFINSHHYRAPSIALVLHVLRGFHLGARINRLIQDKSII
ncbi:hypothetical protein [Candidatus Methylomicrobium oryzae]|uniref:hypothetical protein n=1 Tax=Candidatus Methylomicrobium oryzae TaxID=2802053 RepID=UPI00192477E1|nr:hypothetical protein [Methylomicrobium sp. RS1]